MKVLKCVFEKLNYILLDLNFSMWFYNINMFKVRGFILANFGKENLEILI